MKKLQLSYNYRLNPGFYSIIILIIIAVLTLSSCVTPKNAYYFKTLPRDTSINAAVNRSVETRIIKNDLLSINISSLNPGEDLTYNAAAGGASAAITAGSSGGSGYVVDANGNIQLHKLGLIHVEGMTRAELKNKIQKDIEPFLKDPVVTVRFLNHRVTVLGEVGQAGVIPIPEEGLSIIEVLSASGDVTNLASRNNILVIRESGNTKQLKRINLEDHSIFNSEWFYLQNGDVVYVEPNDKKIIEEKRSKTQQTVGMILSGISIAVIILDRITK